jgi:hypothetical protein
MFTSCYQTTEPNHCTCSKFETFGRTVTNQNCIQKEIKSRLNSGNACYHAVQNILSFRLLSRKVKTEVCKAVSLPVILYECETWSLKNKDKGVSEQGV